MDFYTYLNATQQVMCNWPAKYVHQRQLLDGDHAKQINE